MWEFTSSLWILSLFVLILSSILFWVKKSLKSTFTYWNNHNIPFIPSSSIFGNIKDIVLYRECAAEVLKDLYKDPATKKEPVTGIRIFHKPGLLIRDLELIKRVLVKDFNYFSNRYSASDPHSDSLGSYNLFFVKNPLWKQIRSNLTPIFTSGKMKQFFFLVNDIGKQLDKYLNALPLDEKKKAVNYEIKELCALFTTDVIASTAYGIEANSMNNPDSEFRQKGRIIFQFTPWRAFEFITFFFIPQLVSICKCKIMFFLLSEFTFLLITAATLLYIYARHVNNYWKRHNIPYIQGTPFLGNITDLVFMKKSSSEWIVDLYNHKDAVNHPFVGIHVFQQPALLIRDPELAKVFLIKDFECFPNRHSRLSKRVDPLGAQILFFLRNSTWRQFRLRNSPMFTGSKMKSVFPLIAEIGQKLDRRLTKLTKEKPIVHEIHDLASFFTGDVIASVAFNINANSIENRNNPFHIITSKVFEFSIHRSAAMAAAFFIPSLSEIMRARFFPDVTAKFLRSAIVDVINDREKTEARRNDVIDNLINLKRQIKEKTGEDVAKGDADLLYAQAAAYYTAGFGTTASALGFSLLELAKHPECQERLRKEIHDVLLQYDKNICYEAVIKMEYLHMVIYEAMRFYPTLPFLDRECTLTDGRTHFSMEPYSDFKIPNGMPVYIPAYALHRDPKYFPEPDKFEPERHSPENKMKRPACTLLPFGAGPRNCIGGRLGLLIVKIGLVYFLLNHKVMANGQTPKQIKLDKRAMIIQSEDGLYCDIIHDPIFK